MWLWHEKNNPNLYIYIFFIVDCEHTILIKENTHLLTER